MNGIVVMKRRFNAVPNKDEIKSLLTGENIGDKDNAVQALTNLLSPMKDLLALFQFAEQLDSASEKYAEMLKEQADVETNISSLKAATIKAKKEYDAATDKVKAIQAVILDLENTKDQVIKEVETEQSAKLRLNATISAEYDKLHQEMLERINKEEQEATDTLQKIRSKVEVANKELDALAEKKRAFIASLTS